MRNYDNIEDILKTWFDFAKNVGDLRAAVDLLGKAKVFDILRRIGIPKVLSQGADINVMATQASYSAGYQQALNDVEFFEQTFDMRKQAAVAKALTPDFGGKEAAIASGALTKDDF